ncbi:MAG TPA: flagellar type III secretion system pore protein FliP [Gemmatimonadaceae bacterium]|nr:flagellar type III secretion system pore protein FliP [Gemmatimonadaceae bacterium]
MMQAGLGVLAALAFVLGLIALAVWGLRRWGAGPLRARSALPVEVVQRLPLGPKAALAVVRVGEKVLVVSHGDGGVHAVCDLDEADRQRVLAASPVAVPFANSAPVQQQLKATMSSPFGQTLHSALAAMSPSAAAPTPEPPAATAPAAPVRREPESPRPASPRPGAALDAGLRSALSMTLAPATRLLGALALLAVSAFAPPRTMHAQPAAAPVPAAAPQVAPPQAAPPQAAAGRPAGTAAAAANADVAPDADEAPATNTLTPGQAAAQIVPQLDLRVGTDGAQELRLNGTVGIVLMMGLLTLVPTLLLMMTGFTRILIVLHFLKQAMGTQSAPPAHLVAGLALLLTGFVMAPTITEANRTALQPWLAGEIEQVTMLKEGVKPFRAFMLRQTKEEDLRTFVELSRSARPATPDDVPLHVLMAAFVSSELRTAFQIGFAIYLPFIVIDAVVASVLMAMGMFMLPPAMISLPFKLLLFVLVDGWSLTIQSLIQSFR